MACVELPGAPVREVPVVALVGDRHPFAVEIARPRLETRRRPGDDGVVRAVHVPTLARGPQASLAEQPPGHAPGASARSRDGARPLVDESVRGPEGLPDRHLSVETALFAHELDVARRVASEGEV